MAMSSWGWSKRRWVLSPAVAVCARHSTAGMKPQVTGARQRNTWMQIGYARTGTSPETSARMTYFLDGRDQYHEPDKLLTEAMAEIETMPRRISAAGRKAVHLPLVIARRDVSFHGQGIADGLFFPHDKTVAMAVASIVVHDGDEAIAATEDDLYRREREAFIRLPRQSKHGSGSSPC